MGTAHSRKTNRTPGAPDARERIERTAYQLFSRHGIRAVGVDTLIARSGVAKRTLYRHYPSKDKLAIAFLRRREELWTRAWLQREVEGRASHPAQRLLAAFDVFDEWFRRPDYEACSFVKALIEQHDRKHPVRRAAVRHLEAIREFIAQLARQAGVRDPDAFARQWQVLMMGSIIAAYAGDRDAARRAKEVGLCFLAQHGVASAADSA